MPFDFAAFHRDNPAPDLDGHLDPEIQTTDPADLDTIADLFHQWGDYVSLRADRDRQIARGNLAVADLIAGRMAKAKRRMPEWARWDREATG
jgi:hypothetical protein